MSWWSPSGFSAWPNPIRSTGDEPGALVDQLVEAVLAVRPGLAPVDRPGVVVDGRPVERHVLAVGLHRQLLQVGGEALEVLVVGHDADGLRVEEVAVPHRQKAHEHGQVLGPGAPCGSARPWRGSRRAALRTAPDRRRAWWTARWPSPSSSARPPSPRIRTCCRCRCRTPPPARRWWTRPRSAWRWRIPRPAAIDAASPAPTVALVRVSSVPNVLDETMKSVSSRDRSRVASVKSVESTLETKRNARSRRV